MRLVEDQNLLLVTFRELVEKHLRTLGSGSAWLDAVAYRKLTDEPERTTGAERGIDQPRLLSRLSAKVPSSVDLPRPGSAVSSIAVFDSTAQLRRSSASAKLLCREDTILAH